MGKVWLLTSLFLVFGYTAGVTEVIGGMGDRATSQMSAANPPAVAMNHPKTKKKQVDVADGADEKFKKCSLEDGKPIPTELTADAPECSKGVEDSGPQGTFGCPSVGTAPNLTCPWYLENRMGCNSSSTKMCDTVPNIGAPGTHCDCVVP